MKKKYINPNMKVIEAQRTHLLTSSLKLKSGDVNPNTADAPEFDDDFTW